MFTWSTCKEQLPGFSRCIQSAATAVHPRRAGAVYTQACESCLKGAVSRHPSYWYLAKPLDSEPAAMPLASEGSDSGQFLFCALVLMEKFSHK